MNRLLNKSTSPLFWLLLIAFLSPSLVAQETNALPRVGLLSRGSSVGRSADVLGSVVGDTIELALQQLGEYTFLRLEERGGDAATIAAEEGIEFLLLQRIEERSEGGQVVLELWDAVNREPGGTYVGGFASTLEVFDAADKAILGVLGELAGVEVGFGSLSLQPSGELREYRVILGEAAYDGSPTTLSRLLTGRYPLRITTTDGIEMVRREVEIRAGETTSLELLFPELFTEEIVAFRGAYLDSLEATFDLLFLGRRSEESERINAAAVPAAGVPGMRGLAEANRSISRLFAGESQGSADRPVWRRYREFEASEYLESHRSIGRSTEGALEAFARRVSVPRRMAVRVDGSGEEWGHAKRFFDTPLVTRVGFATEGAQLFVYIEFLNPEIFSTSPAPLYLEFTGNADSPLTVEFTSREEGAEVGSSSWSMQGATSAFGQDGVELAIPKNAFSRQFEPHQRLQLRLHGTAITPDGRAIQLETGYRGAVMPLFY